MAELPYGQGAKLEPYATVLPDVPREMHNYEEVRAADSPDAFGASVARAHENEANQQMFAANLVGKSDEFLAQGMQKLGQGATDAGKFMGQVAADDATNKYMDAETKLLYGDPNKIGPDGQPDRGFFGATGQGALARKAEIMQQMEELRQNLRDTLATPDQMLRFDNDTRTQQARAYREIGSFVEQQSNKWADDTANAWITRGESLLANNPDDPAGIGFIMRGYQARASIRGATPGDNNDPVWGAAQFSAIQHVDMIKAQSLAVHDAPTALKFIQDHAGELGDMAPRLYESVRGRADEQVGQGLGQAWADRISGRAPTVGTNGSTELSPGFEDRLTSGGNYNGKNYGGESGGQWDPKPTPNKDRNGNTYYVYGKYQMGPAEIQQYAPPGTTIEQFRASPDIQTQTFHAYQDDHIRQIHQLGLDKYIGTPINGVPITMDGLVAGAHLGGVQGLENFLKSGKNPSDNLGTSIGSYVERYSAWTKPGGTGDEVAADVAAEDKANGYVASRPTREDALNDIMNNPNLSVRQKEIAKNTLNSLLIEHDANVQKHDMSAVRDVAHRLDDLTLTLNHGDNVNPNDLPDITGLTAIAARNPLVAQAVDEVQAKYESVKYGAQAIAQMRDAAPAQMQTIMNDAAASLPDATPEQKAAKVRILSIYQDQQKKVLEARSADPAQYEQQLDKPMGRQLNDAIASSLRRQMPDPMLKPTIEKMLAAQDAHGIPTLRQTVLTVPQAQQWAGDIMSGSMKLESLRKAFGDTFYNKYILPDLETRGGMSPVMTNAEYFPPAMQKGIRDQLTDKESDKKAKERFGDMDAKTNPVHIALQTVDGAATSGPLGRLLNYLDASGVSGEIKNSYVDAIKAAATSEVMNGRATAGNGAGQNAIDAFMRHWSELNVNDSGTQPWVRASDAQKMSTAATAIRTYISHRPNYIEAASDVHSIPDPSGLFPMMSSAVGMWVGVKDTNNIQMVGFNGVPVRDAVTKQPIIITPNTVVPSFNARTMPPSLPLSGN